MVWHIMNAIIFIVAVAAGLNVLNYIKLNKVLYDKKESIFEYRDNPLLSEVTEAGNKNEIFKNTLETKPIIDRYLISYDDLQPYLLCHLTKSIDDSNALSIFEYNKHKRLINMRRIKDASTLQNYPMIELLRDTKMVNIVFDNQETIIEHVKTKFKACRKVALRQSIALFLFLIPLSYLMLYLLVQNYSDYSFFVYINRQTILLGLSMIMLSSVFNYLLITLSFHARHKLTGDHGE